MPVGGTRGRDGAPSFNLVHVYPNTVLHSVVPLGHYPTLDYVDADGVGPPPRRRRHPHPSGARAANSRRSRISILA